MGNCYSVDHIAEDHMHTDIRCNIEEQQQKYRFGTVSNRLLGWGWGAPKTCFNGFKSSLLASAVVRNIWSACGFSKQSINQQRKQTNYNKGL